MRRQVGLYSGIVVAFGLGASALFLACGSGSSGSCVDTATCIVDASVGDGGGDDAPSSEKDSAAGFDGGDGGGAGGDACAVGSEPQKQAACVSDAYGVFVKAGAPAGGNGTKASPFGTLGEALGAVQGTRDRLYVCSGTYAETVTAAAGALRGIFGGLDCATWAPGGGATTIDPREAGHGKPAMTLASAEGVLANLSLVAPDGKDPGESSLGVFLTGGGAWSLKRVNITTGLGQDGKAGGTADAGWSGVATPGNPATTKRGADEQACTCPGGAMTVGGGGGTADSTQPSPGFPGRPVADGGAGGLGASNPGKCGNGNPGAGGAEGHAGSGATKHGALDASGWRPANGDSGNPGGIAQGGGGGGGDKTGLPVGGGGSGGCGGCGGGAGLAGGGGGASVALLAFGTRVEAAGGAWIVGRGGAGGPGGVGAPGQIGGDVGAASRAGCRGGPGGTGGRGGGGGGGAGGVRAPALFHGGAVTLTGVTVTVDTSVAAPAGKGGSPGGTDGASGITSEAPIDDASL